MSPRRSFRRALQPEIFWKQKLIHEFGTDQVNLDTTNPIIINNNNNYRENYQLVHSLKYGFDPFLFVHLPEYQKLYYHIIDLTLGTYGNDIIAYKWSYSILEIIIKYYHHPIDNVSWHLINVWSGDYLDINPSSRYNTKAQLDEYYKIFSEQTYVSEFSLETTSGGNMFNVGERSLREL